MTKLLWTYFLTQILCLTLFGNNGGTNKIVLDDFTEASKPFWEMRSGKNIKHSLSFEDKIKLGDKEETVMSLEFEKKDALDNKGNRNWFEFKRPLSPQASWENASAIRKIELSRASKYTVKFQPVKSGYYDVKAYWLDKNNKKLSKHSCVKTTGSLEQGRGTFAVMPNTIEENSKRTKALGTKAFFGFHGGHFYELTKLMGTSWLLDTSRWVWDEKNEKPKRINGRAEWVDKLMKNENSYTKDNTVIINYCMNLRTPEWAVAKPMGKAPGMKDPDEYFRYFGDRIEASKFLYPEMKRRIYDIFWEVSLNKPGATKKPTYFSKDIVNAYKKARKVMKQKDPEAMLAGPCPNNIRELPWLEALCKEGLLKYIDVYNGHGYHTPPPEEGQVVEKTRQLKELLKKYNKGKAMDIYCTELGYRSQYGSKDRHKEQAQWHARVAVMLKGEGVKAYFPFYSYDFKGDNQTWGVCYNLDPKLKWGPNHVSPKAAVPALAVCVNELEGTSPVSDLPFFGNNIWCYIFKDDKSAKPIIVIWSVHNKHKLKLPVGNVDSLEITNIMGHRSTVDVKDGFADIKVSPSPLYIKGASEDIYISDKKVEDNILTQRYPGEKIKLKISNKLSRKLTFWGDVEIKPTKSGVLDISIPADCKPGPIPVLFGNKVRWLIVKEPIEVVKTSLENRKSGMVIELDIKNRGVIDVPVTVSLESDGASADTITATLKQKSETKLCIPLKLDGKIDVKKPLTVRLKIKPVNFSEIKLNKTFSFITAHLRGESGDGKLQNTIKWSGKGSSGKEDNAKASFEWDKKNLYLKIEVEDETFYQTCNDGAVWQMDSLQIAFDTHPEFNAVYEPLAGVATKKISDIAIAKTPEGNLVWRHNTFNGAELKLGNVSSAFDIDIVRNKSKKTTVYNLVIPWKEIGLDKVKKGKPIGISILVNDSDGPGTSRAGLELFSGIMKDKTYKLYGMFTLR